MTRILLVDDDIELSGMLAEYFEQEGFHAHTVGDGESGVSAALSNDFDVVVLDVMMPRMNGIEVLRAIRARSTVPVLMLTARGDDIDRILGLELGADDYVPKPCSPRELVARVRAILRRLHPDKAEANQDAQIQAGELIMWPQSRTAQWGHTPLELTGTEFRLLETLVRHAGSVVSKRELSTAALGRPLARFDRSIDVHISSIRQKLANLSGGRSSILTERGMGYRMIVT